MNMLRIPGTALRERGVPRSLRRARHPRLAGLHVRELRLPDRRRRLPRRLSSARRGRRSPIFAGRPSLAVLCGGSEVEQQAAMLGLDPALGRGELFGELLPRLASEAGADVPYVPSAPCGGDLPFRTDRGVANYYGVGGYRRPLDRRAARGRALRRRVPRVRERPRRRVADREPGGRRPPRRSARLGLRRCPRPLPRAALRRGPVALGASTALPRAVAGGDGRGDGRGASASGGAPARRAAAASSSGCGISSRAPAGGSSTTRDARRLRSGICAACSRRPQCG